MSRWKKKRAGWQKKKSWEGNNPKKDRKKDAKTHKEQQDLGLWGEWTDKMFRRRRGV